MGQIDIAGLNSKHLTKGSVEPTKSADGFVRLYSMRFCPYVERVAIALQLKKIPFEVVNLSLQEKPEWYLAKNPLGKVPSIEHKGKILYESLVIVDYLDETFNTGKRIVPTDPYEKATQRMLVERLSGVLGLHQWLRNREDEAARKKVFDGIELYESLLQQPFFAGEQARYADYMIWPWVERLSSAEILSNKLFAVTPEKYPKFAAYIERMKALPEIQGFFLDGKTHAKFVESRQDGKANYDIVV